MSSGGGNWSDILFVGGHILHEETVIYGGVLINGGLSDSFKEFKGKAVK